MHATLVYPALLIFYIIDRLIRLIRFHHLILLCDYIFPPCIFHNHVGNNNGFSFHLGSRPKLLSLLCPKINPICPFFQRCRLHLWKKGHITLWWLCFWFQVFLKYSFAPQACYNASTKETNPCLHQTDCSITLSGLFFNYHNNNNLLY